jgi:hypothetical protein
LPLAGSQLPAGKKYALLVGVQNYNHSNFTNLQFADNDTSELAKLLHGHDYEVKLLTSKDATLARIRQELAALVKKRTRNDLVLVGLAGHGLHLDGTSYFCPKDAEPADAKTMLPVGEVYGLLKNCGAGTKLLLVDACRNDPVRGVRRRGIDDAPSAPAGVGALFSCSAGQFSFEAQKYKHGVFFYHVLQGLGGKAKNRKGQVTWDSLRAYVKEEMEEDVPRLFPGTRQVPHETGSLSAIPVLVEAARRAPAPAPAPAPVPATSRFQANTVWQGTFFQGERRFSITIRVKERKQERIKGEIHVRFEDGGRGVLTFQGRIEGSTKVVWTTNKVSGDVISPGRYEGRIEGRTLSGTWRVPSWKLSGRFTVKLKN